MKLRHKQKGVIAIVVVVGMVAILAMAGLALDGGHAMLNKTRLQNAVDAAALSGAKELDLTGKDVFLARAAAEAAFGANSNASGNAEMGQAYADGTIQLEVQFSKTLDPFVPGTSPAEYVRVYARNFRLPMWFARVVTTADKAVAASAVAGPSPTINTACNIAPMMVCGAPEKTDEYPNGGPPFWGYTPGEPDVLKTSSNCNNVGPGNFQLIRLGDNTGGADIRLAMAGGYDGCASAGDVVQTEPGNKVEPVATGLNTRFGSYSGTLKGTESTYPPDVITTQPLPLLTSVEKTIVNEDGKEICFDEIYQGSTLIKDGADLSYNYDDYQSQLKPPHHDYDFAPPVGQFQRRELAIPIGDCSETTNGQGAVPVLGFGCFFLSQEARMKGNESEVYGQFIRDCHAGGLPGPAPGDGPGLYIIQLYKDPDSPDS
jgi:hypothetical protein